MKYYPVAIKYFFSENELEDFRKNADYKAALHPYTFCHYVAASRQRKDILLGTSEKLGCSNAKYVMGWKELDDNEVKSHLKYTKDWDQAKRFVKTKKQLPQGLLAFATAPLHKAPMRRMSSMVSAMCYKRITLEMIGVPHMIRIPLQ